MALRVFTDPDGHEWNVWQVRPVSGEASPLPARFRDGWLCFERTSGGGRCRVPMDQVPPGWDSLPPDRLELLRRVAEQPVNTPGPGSGERRTARVEDCVRGLDSGPREAAGGPHDAEGA